MRRALWGLIWGGAMVVCRGRTADLELRLGPSEMAAEGGRLTTRNVVIRNSSAQPVEVREMVSLPAGWRQVPMADPVFEIAAGASVLRMVAVAIPSAGSAGRHELRYQLLDRRNEAAVGEITLPIEVLSTARIEVSVGEPPKSVVAGDAIEYTATFVNRGNREVEMSVEGKATPQAAVEVVPSVFPLPAGAAVEVRIRVPTDEAQGRRLLYLVQWVATGRWAEGTLKVRMPSQAIEVVASTGSNFDAFHRLPAQWTTTAAWESGRHAGIQSELAGRGALTEDGGVRTDFRFRGPDGAGAESSLRRQEEYGLSLSSAVWDLHLGDRSFEFSPLLKARGNDRGIGLSYHQGSVQAGGFVANDRGDPLAPPEAGGTLGWNAPGGISLRWNSLITADEERQAVRLHSVQAGWSLTPLANLLFEAAMDEAAPEFDEGSAWRAEGYGRLGARGGWHASHLRAGSEFRGATTGQTTTALGFFQEVTSWARLVGEFRLHENGVLRDGQASTSTARDQSWRFGPRMRLSERATLHLDYRRAEHEAGRLGEVEQSRDDVVGVGLSHEFRRWSVGWEQEIGGVDRFSEGAGRERGIAWRSSITALWRASDRQSYSGAVGVGEDTARSNAGRTVDANVSGMWQLGRSVRCQASAHHRQDPDGDQTATAVQGRAEWVLPNRHEIVGTVRVAGLGGHREVETAVMVNYRIPLSLQMSRRRGFGTLQGRVVDGDGARSRPVARAVVRLDTGETAVTDSGGNYLFAGLKPGDYTVTVDQRSMGFGRVTADLLPQRLRVCKDAVSALDIRVVSAATLTVTMTIFEETPALPGKDAGVAGAGESHRPTGPQVAEVVEVSNGQETFRRLTTVTGEAVFPNLRPGRWTVRAYDSQIPARHFVERPELERTLEAGATVREAFRVLPKRRKILLIDS